MHAKTLEGKVAQSAIATQILACRDFSSLRIVALSARQGFFQGASRSTSSPSFKVALLSIFDGMSRIITTSHAGIGCYRCCRQMSAHTGRSAYKRKHASQLMRTSHANPTYFGLASAKVVARQHPITNWRHPCFRNMAFTHSLY